MIFVKCLNHILNAIYDLVWVNRFDKVLWNCLSNNHYYHNNISYDNMIIIMIIYDNDDMIIIRKTVLIQWNKMKQKVRGKCPTNMSWKRRHLMSLHYFAVMQIDKIRLHWSKISSQKKSAIVRPTQSKVSQATCFYYSFYGHASKAVLQWRRRVEGW